MDSQPIIHKYGWDAPASRSRFDSIDVTIVLILVTALLGLLVFWISSLQNQIVNDHTRNTNQTARINHLSALVKQLDFACMPLNTGGGVTQCQQPNVLQAPPSK